MYPAIDLLVDKLDRCVKKHKEKKRDHHATEAQRTARNLASL
jgi:putative sigma-54 modulation protein